MPVIQTSKEYVVNVLQSNLFFICTLKTDNPPLLAIEFLNRVHDVFYDYFQRVDESTLKVIRFAELSL